MITYIVLDILSFKYRDDKRTIFWGIRSCMGNDDRDQNYWYGVGVFKRYGFEVIYSIEEKREEYIAINKLRELLKNETKDSVFLVNFLEKGLYVSTSSDTWYSNWREYCKDWYSSSLAESIDKV